MLLSLVVLIFSWTCCSAKILTIPLQGLTQSEINERSLRHAKMCRTASGESKQSFRNFISKRATELLIGTIDIGVPNRTLGVVFDTNTYPIWLPSSRRNNADTLCSFSMHKTYDYSSSRGYLSTGTPFLLTKPDGIYEGMMGIDQMWVDNYRIRYQPFGEMLYTNSPDYKFAIYDGVFGLNLIEDHKLKSPIYNLFHYGFIQEQIFSFYVNRSTSPLTGAVTFGEVSEDFFTGIIDYYYLKKRGRYNDWRLTMTIAHVIDYEFCLFGCEALFVTSSEYIYAPVLVSYEINVLLGASKKLFRYPKYAELWTVSCDLHKKEHIPDISFVFDNNRYVLEPKYLISTFHIGSQLICFTNIRDHDLNYIIVGMPFFKQYYTVYEMNNNPLLRRIGIARAAN